jgi:hypothetical protein
MRSLTWSRAVTTTTVGIVPPGQVLQQLQAIAVGQVQVQQDSGVVGHGHQGACSRQVGGQVHLNCLLCR